MKIPYVNRWISTENTDQFCYMWKIYPTPNFPFIFSNWSEYKRIISKVPFWNFHEDYFLEKTDVLNVNQWTNQNDVMSSKHKENHKYYVFFLILSIKFQLFNFQTLWGEEDMSQLKLVYSSKFNLISIIFHHKSQIHVQWWRSLISIHKNNNKNTI